MEHPEKWVISYRKKGLERFIYFESYVEPWERLCFLTILTYNAPDFDWESIGKLQRDEELLKKLMAENCIEDVKCFKNEDS